MKILKIFIAKKKTHQLKTQIFNFANTIVIYMSTSKHITRLKMNNISRYYWKKKGEYFYQGLEYNKDDLVSNFYTCNSISKSRRINKIISLKKVIFQKLLVSATYCFRAYIRVRGIGYKFIINHNLFMIHLGYSHVNIIDMPPGMIAKLSRKSTRLLLQDRRLQSLMPFRATVRKFRKFDIFKGKGVRYRYTTYKLKEGKKKKTF